MKKLRVKNKPNKPLTLTFTPSNCQSISILIDDHASANSTNRAIGTRPILHTHPSDSSLNTVEQIILMREKEPTTFAALCHSMITNSDFFIDMYTLFPKRESKAIEEYFRIQVDAFDKLITQAKNVTGQPITIEPQSKQLLFVLLVPQYEKADEINDPLTKGRWTHRRESISITIDDANIESVKAIRTTYQLYPFSTTLRRLHRSFPCIR